MSQHGGARIPNAGRGGGMKRENEENTDEKMTSIRPGVGSYSG